MKAILNDVDNSFEKVYKLATQGQELSAYSWKGIMHISIIEQACERSIIPELQRILSKYVAESSMTDEGERYFDFFPMEELTSAADTR